MDLEFLCENLSHRSEVILSICTIQFSVQTNLTILQFCSDFGVLNADCVVFKIITAEPQRSA